MSRTGPSRFQRAAFALFVSFLVTATYGPAAAQPLTLGGSDLVDPSCFVVTRFMEGLDFPYAMAELPDGSLLVGSGSPGSYFASSGQLIRLLDADGDGVADESQILHASLPGGVTDISLVGDLVITTSSRGGTGSERISFFRLGAAAWNPLTPEGVLHFEFPRPWLHTTFAHAVRPTPDGSGAHELYFNVGSETNFAASTRTVTTAGLLAGARLDGDAIYRVTLRDDGRDVSLSDLVKIASGVRNAAGMRFHPVTGDLYFEDNGIDGLEDPNEPLSADELNRIPVDELGGTVEDFGFPAAYVEYRTGRTVGSRGITPLVAFQPLGDPLTGDEAEGAVQIAFAPPSFPARMRGGVFVGMHGKYVLAGPENEENPLVFVDLATGEVLHFIGVDEPGIGHLDGLLATEDALYLADLSPAGGLNATGSGVIYRIRAVPADKQDGAPNETE